MPNTFSRRTRSTNVLPYMLLLILFAALAGISIFLVKKTAIVDLDNRSQAAPAGQEKITNIAIGASSSIAANPASNAIDGNQNTFWNAGAFPSQWVQLDLRNPNSVNRMRLLVKQSPAGNTTHKIYAGANPNPTTLVKILTSNTTNGTWLEATFDPPLQNVRYIKVETTQSPSWVSWSEIEVYKPVTYQDVGWDSGLRRKCVTTYTFLGSQRSAPRSLTSQYQDTADCQGDITQQATPKWLISFHSEASYAAAGQCLDRFALNTASSPLKVNWLKQPDGHYWVQLFSDYSAKSHPCTNPEVYNPPQGYFNWLVLQQQNSQNLYPKPQDSLMVKYKLWYDSFYPGTSPKGAARVIATWSGYWKDQNGKSKARNIEVSLRLENWGDGDPDPKVVSSLKTDNFDFVFVDGGAYGYQLGKGADQDITIDWQKIIQDMQAAGYITPPVDSNTATTGLGVGVETNNRYVTNSVITNLYVKNFEMFKK